MDSFGQLERADTGPMTPRPTRSASPCARSPSTRPFPAHSTTSPPPRSGSTSPPPSPRCNADPALLERVLVNLLGNAVRHSPPHTPPHLTGSVHGQRVELQIIDHGPGIPATDRDAAFRAFQRLGDNDNTSGIGLGLALSRDLTEAMGGTLTAESTPGGGLTMILTLTAATRREQLPKPADRPR